MRLLRQASRLTLLVDKSVVRRATSDRRDELLLALFRHHLAAREAAVDQKGWATSGEVICGVLLDSLVKPKTSAAGCDFGVEVVKVEV